MAHTLSHAFTANFLGQSPNWYKITIIAFLIINPILLNNYGPFFTGWCLIIEFIFTLAMALKCYPLQPGGLLAIEAIILGMSSPSAVYEETVANFPVILLLMFMVAGIYFMKDLLLYVFSRLLVEIKSKLYLSLLFSSMAAFLSAFLDALTVTAVLISVSIGFYSIYHQVASGKKHYQQDHDHGHDNQIIEYHREDLEQFRAFLRSLLMHGAVGTALGGATTLVGEPQNLKIALEVGWNFREFFFSMAPVSIPVLLSGLATCYFLEQKKLFGYGTDIPDNVREVLERYTKEQRDKRTIRHRAQLIVQSIVAIILILSLAFHLAEVGIIGLMVIVLLTTFNGITEEQQLGKAFEEALPFTALLVVFFAIVAVIHEQHLFSPIIDYVLAMEKSIQPSMFFLANGVLSMISDNVFVATVYISEVKSALDSNTIDVQHFEHLAIAINAGTNLPSVATPNGQAAFLFLLTSSIAPLLRLSYGTMVWMALPYTIVLTTLGFICCLLFL